MQNLRRIESAVEIVKRRHRVGRIDRLFHETRRKERSRRKQENAEHGNLHDIPRNHRNFLHRHPLIKNRHSLKPYP